MTTSGTTTFSVTRDDIIKSALRKIGVVAQGELPTVDQTQEAAFALNTLVKSWEADGMPLWALRTIAIPVVASKTTYTIGTAITNDIITDKPLKVIQAWNRNSSSNVDIPMRILTKYDYNMLGNKSTLGTPIQIYYEPLATNGSLSLFPTPSISDVSTSTIYIVFQRPYEDINTATDTPDFPQEWYDAVIYGLAVRLASEYGLPIDQRQVLGREAADIKLAALSFNTEEGSLYFGIEKRNW
jgi:hypothetical protein